MAKRGRLSKDEKQYISEHAIDGAEKISEHLNRSISVVEKELASQPQETETEESRPKAGELMARNEKYGAVMMTESASMASDESRNSNPEPEEEEEEEAKDPVVSRRHRGSIHRIKE